MAAADEYSLLIDPRAGMQGAVRLLMPAGVPLDTVATILRDLLDDGQVDRVILVVDGNTVGATSAGYARVVFGMSIVRGPGDEARAGWPGESTRYSLIEFVCQRCGACAYTVFYDDRYTPVCDQHGHGPMRWRARRA